MSVHTKQLLDDSILIRWEISESAISNGYETSPFLVTTGPLRAIIKFIYAEHEIRLVNQSQAPIYIDAEAWLEDMQETYYPKIRMF